MKKILIFMLTIFLILPLASAVEFDMKSSFSQGETLIAKLSGNFVEPITKNQVLFYRGHTRDPLEFSVERIDNDFYIYAQLFGENEGNYSVVVENAKYQNINEIVQEDLEKNFTITNQTSDFFLNPGVVKTNEIFSIEIQNLRNNEITISSTNQNTTSSGGFFESLFGGNNQDNEGTETLTLKAQEKKSFDFNIEDFSPGLNTLYLSSENTIYEIPVYITSDTSIPEKNVTGLVFEPEELNITITINSNTSRILLLHNLGNLLLENITISASDELIPYLEISDETFDEIEENSTERVEFVFSSGNEAKSLEGQIKAKALNDKEEVYAYVYVSLNFIEAFVPAGTDEGNPLPQTCEDLSGNICAKNKECSGQIKYVSDGVCCIGSCVEKQKSSTGKIIGWGIVIIILILLVWFYLKKYKKTNNPVDLLRFVKRKQ